MKRYLFKYQISLPTPLQQLKFRKIPLNLTEDFRIAKYPIIFGSQKLHYLIKIKIKINFREHYQEPNHSQT